MINGNYIWQVGSTQEVNDNYDEFHHVILQLLKKRGIVTPEQIHGYIYPKLDNLYDPMLLKDMDKAVVRIKEALSKKQKVTIYGDYDADGITSCAVLMKLLKNLGGTVNYYIPSRLDEGYGLNKDAIDMIHKQGTKLIITVDNGISSCEEVQYASSLGLDVIITDHHEPQQKMPQAAIAIVDPKREDCSYPFKELAGVGVALKLACALKGKDLKFGKELLELAAIGTVADIVPLLDENRIIVKNGLDDLGNTKNLGLKAMMNLLNLNDISIEPGKISYLLAPRLNAAGRIANPEIAVELLLCEDAKRAFELATTLERINQERQTLEAKILDEAKTVIEQEIDLDIENIIVISSANWHPGVTGTVASKLVEIYSRPCIIISEKGDEGRGSGRSISGFNLFNALSKLSHLLIRFGGHEQAAGLSIKVENIGTFRRELNQLFVQDTVQKDASPKLDIDLELNQSDINLKLAEQLELMKPFGYGNPKPVFMCRNLHIQNLRTVGSGDKHLKLNLKSHENNIDAIGFNFGLYKEDLDMATIMDAAFYLEVNRWKGSIEPQLNIKDLRVPFFRDELLLDVENNYYRYFYSYLNVLNGKSIRTSSEDKLINEDNMLILKNKRIQAKIGYINSLLKAKSKVMIAINTPYKAWQLLTYLREDDDLRNRAKVSYCLDLPAQSHDYNVIAVNPLAICNNKNFEDIVFYDTPFSVDILKKQLAEVPPNSKTHILFEREDLRYNYLVCQQILPSINELKVVYQMIGKLTLGTFEGSLNINEFRNLLQKQSGIDMHLCKLINVFKIFQEIGIIKLNIEDGFFHILGHEKHNNKFQLERSKTYLHLYLLKRNVVEFYNKFQILQSDIFMNVEEIEWT